jgi:hypothetical protein
MNACRQVTAANDVRRPSIRHRLSPKGIIRDGKRTRAGGWNCHYTIIDSTGNPSRRGSRRAGLDTCLHPLCHTAVRGTRPGSCPPLLVRFSFPDLGSTCRAYRRAKMRSHSAQSHAQTLRVSRVPPRWAMMAIPIPYSDLCTCITSQSIREWVQRVSRGTLHALKGEATNSYRHGSRTASAQHDPI